MNAPAVRDGRLDLRSARRLHIVGVGGAGMSAIATVLAGRGHSVSGSDLRDTRVLERLRLIGVDARGHQRAANIESDLDAVIISTAIPEQNVEVAAAHRLGIPVLHRRAALRAMTETTASIAVAGSHGKTTTASMLALILREAGWHPSFVIGADVNEVGTNAVHDVGEWMVVEADESDGTFLELRAAAGVLTNVEPDHLDYYGSFDALLDAFARWLVDIDGPRVVCGDDPQAARLAATATGPPPVTYGFAAGSGYRIEGFTPERFGTSFALRTPAGASVPIHLPIPGRHNAANATGAAAIALELGVEPDAVARALGGFGGVARRFQVRGVRDGVTYVDDYAHLPTEIAAAITTARDAGYRRVVAVFQPHRYSRTATLWPEFADAFEAADQIVLTDVYAAGEAPRPGVSGHLLLGAVLDAHPDAALAYLPRRVDLERVVPAMAGTGDIVLTLGAGDVTTLPDVWLAEDELAHGG